MRAVLLFPFTVIYCAIYLIWNFYWNHRKPVRVKAKVISVGNVAVGGSGKTTVVEFIGRKLLEEGRKVAVVARGYGRLKGGSVVVRSESKLFWEECGDEPAGLARSIPGLAVYVDSDKTKAALRAAGDGYDLIIVDDGFQHRKLHRDIDIVCLESSKPFGNGLLLPSGCLREPQRSLKRADVIILIDYSGEQENVRIMSGGDVPVSRARKRAIGIRSLAGEPVDIRGKKVLAFCGLANPQSFRSTLQQTAVDVALFKRFPDHHVYRSRDIDDIIDNANIHNAVAALTTLKDAVKLEALWPPGFPLYYLQIAIELENEAEFLRLMRR